MFLTVYAVTAMRSFLNSVFSNFLFMSEDFSKVMFFFFQFQLRRSDLWRRNRKVKKYDDKSVAVNDVNDTDGVDTKRCDAPVCIAAMFSPKINTYNCEKPLLWTIGWLWLYSCYYLRCYFQVC